MADADFLEILDWLARNTIAGKRGSTPAQAPERLCVQANLPILRQTRTFEDETNAATTRPLYNDLCPAESK